MIGGASCVASGDSAAGRRGAPPEGSRDRLTGTFRDHGAPGSATRSSPRAPERSWFPAPREPPHAEGSTAAPGPDRSSATTSAGTDRAGRVLVRRQWTRPPGRAVPFCCYAAPAERPTGPIRGSGRPAQLAAREQAFPPGEPGEARELDAARLGPLAVRHRRHHQPRIRHVRRRQQDADQRQRPQPGRPRGASHDDVPIAGLPLVQARLRQLFGLKQ